MYGFVITNTHCVFSVLEHRRELSVYSDWNSLVVVVVVVVVVDK